MQTADLLLTDTRTSCDTSLSFGVTVNALPDVTISGNDSFCLGDTGSYSLSSTAQSYSWSASSGGTSSTSSFEKIWSGAGQQLVYLSVTDTGTSCVNADTIKIWVQDYPLSTPSVLCENEAALVQVSNTSNVNYSWTASGGSILSGQGGAKIQVQYTSDGNYSIQVEIADIDFGCAVTESVNVIVRPKPVGGAIFHY